MDKKNLNTFIIILLFIALILRETPYLNLFFIDKAWVIYIFLLFLFIALNLAPKMNFIFKINYSLLVLVSSMILLLLSLIFTLVGPKSVADILGIIIYFLLWSALILRMIDFLKELRDK